MPSNRNKSEFFEEGVIFEKSIVPKKWIRDVHNNMLEIMSPYCKPSRNGQTVEQLVDDYFSQISAYGQTAKSNIYSCFGKLASLPEILQLEGIKRSLKDIGLERCTIQAYSIFCLEPGNVKHKFLPHQDLRGRASFNSAVIWIPLSSGEGLGGMSCWPRSHKNGPLKHKLNENGQLEIATREYKDFKKRDLSDYELGDAIFMSPYLVHESVVNTGKKIRWTAIIKVDDICTNRHLLDSPNPFIVEDYIDCQSNAERLMVR